MATNAKWAGKPHKTREPIRARERSRRPGPGAQPFPLYVSRLAAPKHQRRGGSIRAKAGVRRRRVHASRHCHRRIAPFLHRFSKMHFITPCPPATCKSRSEKWCNSWLTLPPNVLCCRLIRCIGYWLFFPAWHQRQRQSLCRVRPLHGSRGDSIACRGGIGGPTGVASGPVCGLVIPQRQSRDRCRCLRPLQQASRAPAPGLAERTEAIGLAVPGLRGRPGILGGDGIGRK